MSQQTRERQHPEQQEEGENGNELKEPELKMADNRRRIPLPLELNCKIFEFLKFRIQRKFIGGLGRGICGICRQKVLKKSKRLKNPEQNDWDNFKADAIIPFNGLSVNANTGNWLSVFAKKGFPISGGLSRTDNFSGTILYYFEGTIMASSYRNYCWLSLKKYHPFEWPNGAIKPEWSYDKNVLICGLWLNPENELSIFFTGNGILMGKQIPINPTADTLYPTVSLEGNASVEANFGDDSAKPFKYDIKKCPGLVFE